MSDCPFWPLEGDQSFALRTSLDDGISSLALDAEAHVGYKFGGKVTIKFFGSVTDFTDMPVVPHPRVAGCKSARTISPAPRSAGGSPSIWDLRQIGGFEVTQRNGCVQRGIA